MGISLNALDVIVWVILIYSVVQGILYGMTHQFVSIGALVLGLLIAAWYYPRLAPMLMPYFRTYELAAFLAFIIIFILVKLIGAGVGFLLGKLLAAAELRWFDRVLGGFFGFAKGFLLSAVLFLGLLAFPFELKWVKNAKMAPYLMEGARFISTLTPPEVKTRFDDGLNKLRTIWKESGST